MANGRRLVTITEAAHYLNKSTRTIHRYIAKDRLKTVQTLDGRLVDLTGMMETAPPASVMETAALKAEQESLQTRVNELQAENRRLADTIGQLTGERDYLRQALAASLGTQRLLAQPALAPKRPWWQFWKPEQPTPNE